MRNGALRTIARRGRLQRWTHYLSLESFALIIACAIAFLLGAVRVGLYATEPSIGLLIVHAVPTNDTDVALDLAKM